MINPSRPLTAVLILAWKGQDNRFLCVCSVVWLVNSDFGVAGVTVEIVDVMSNCGGFSLVGVDSSMA